MGPDHSEQKLDPTDVDDDANAAQPDGTGPIIIIGARYHFPKLSDAIIRIIERLQPGLCELSSCALIFQRVVGDGARQRDSGRLQAVRVSSRFAIMSHVSACASDL